MKKWKDSCNTLVPSPFAKHMNEMGTTIRTHANIVRHTKKHYHSPTYLPPTYYLLEQELVAMRWKDNKV
jgi:hypothetical protein